MTLRGWRAPVAVAAVGALVLGLASAASSAEDGQWYVDALGIRAANADGYTGDGVVIAVIDGQINPAVPTLRSADLRIREPSFCEDTDGGPAPAATEELSTDKATDHGTNAVSMIVGNGEGYSGQSGVVGIAPEATVLYYAAYSTRVDGSIACPADDDPRGYVDDAAAAAMEEAMDAGADIISISLSLSAGQDIISALARAFREGVIVLGSLSNTNELTTTTGIPGIANGAIGVQAGDASGVAQSTNGILHTDSDTDVVAPGVAILVQGNPETGSWQEQTMVAGTSLATPLVAGALALAQQAFPEATGNQLIQSLIHNTTGEPNHEPVYDPERVYGYGVLSVANLLAVDPTQYPDVNPLIKEVAGSNDVLIPTWDEIFNPVTAEPTTTPPGGPVAESENGTPVATIVGVVAGLLVVAGLVVVIAILATRRSRAARGESRSTEG